MRILCAVILSAHLVTLSFGAYAVDAYTEEELIPNIRLSPSGQAKIRTSANDPIRISAEISTRTLKDPGVTASYTVKPNRSDLKLVNISVKLESVIPERPVESGAVHDSYGFDRAGDTVEGSLTDSKFSAIATKQTNHLDSLRSSLFTRHHDVF